ncbi:DUF433 domain-containing protein [Nocardioides flavescens]|uniref:DUF433 domain-containing protein n=1 Tax=Nocardioides flavescens TaxID=2691959 RepID=A0A6L7F099_9ACTN|nr:DUF433 domain-containing protein [Nocardioides flavescens]MXG90199.1 DUF433 domain-containing protein [Nocardioides flavescens]
MTALAEPAAVDKFEAALCTQTEAARFLALSESTFRNWARGYHVDVDGRHVVGAPVLSTVPKVGPRGPNIPFVGLAEGYALSAIRKTGVPLQRIRPALERLNQEVGLGHALASEQLFTDGAEVLFDYGEREGGEQRDAVQELVVVRNGQRVFAEVVVEYLQRIEFGSDGFATAIPLPGFRRAGLVADVRRSFGQPVFTASGVRLEDAIALFKAERDIDVVSEEYGIPRIELEDALAVLLN